MINVTPDIVDISVNPDLIQITINETGLRGDIISVNNILATGTPSATTFLRGDGIWTQIAGTGTVTSVSVNSANGFSGTVSNANIDPVITISTTISGLLKANGTSISAAVSNADYQIPISLTTSGTSGAATFNGATLNIPQYGNVTNPMTALGDIIYGGASGAVTKLSGSTSASKRFLTQTGTGSASAAPAWGAILASDIVSGAALTKTDDTNVTLTLGGSPSSALLAAASLTLGWSGVLAVGRGGTGLSALGTANQLLRVNSGATALEYFTPSYLTANQTITLSGAVTGSGTTAITTTLANSIVGIANLSATGTASASTYLRGDNTWATVSGVTDGDKGDITVSASGATWTIDNGVVTVAKISATGTASSSTYLRGDGTWSAVTSGFTNPMTTLGDVIYGGASGAATRLSGNTTTTKNFLSQTGDGTNSAAPSWSAITKSDVGLGNVENTALSTWAGSTNITTLGTISTGTWSGTTIAVAKGGTGLTSLGTANQLIRVNAGATALEYFTPSYLTANQTITLSGAVSGSGTTTITTTLANSVVGVANLSATGTASASTYLRGDNTWATVSGVTDGDKGDITVSNSGATWTIDAGAVSYADIQNVAANSFLANATGTAATVQEIATNRIPLFSSAITGTPSASTYLRGDGSWAAVSGSGTVTSVALTAPTNMAVTGSPITSSGTLALSFSSGYQAEDSTENEYALISSFKTLYNY